MTPIRLEILLHYYARIGEFRDGDFSAPAVSLAMEDFCAIGMLNRDIDGSHQITAKGRFYIDYILSVPFPVSTYAIPEF